SQGFASPPNMVMTRTLGAIAGLSAAAGRERVAISSAAARTDEREAMAGSMGDFSESEGDSQEFEPFRHGLTELRNRDRPSSRQKLPSKIFSAPPCLRAPNPLRGPAGVGGA